MRRRVTHLRRTQHWTHCGAPIRLVRRWIRDAEVPALVSEARGRPEHVCRSCYETWRWGDRRR